MRLRRDLGQDKGAVGHHVAGTDEFVAMLLDRSLMNRQSGLTGQQFKEVRSRLVQSDLKGAINYRSHTDHVEGRAVGAGQRIGGLICLYSLCQLCGDLGNRGIATRSVARS